MIKDCTFLRAKSFGFVCLLYVFIDRGSYVVHSAIKGSTLSTLSLSSYFHAPSAQCNKYLFALNWYGFVILFVDASTDEIT